MAYASNVSRLQDTLQNLTSEKANDLSELEQKYQSQQMEYSEKENRDMSEGSEYQNIGLSTLQGVIGVKGLKATVGKAKEAVGKVKDTITDLQDKGESLINKARATGNDMVGSARGQVEEMAQQAQNRVRTALGGDTKELIRRPTTLTQAEPPSATSLQADYDPLSSSPALEQAEGRTLQSVKNPLFGGNDVADGSSMAEAGESVAETGEKEAGSAILDAVAEGSALDALPVIGEGAAIVGGLVAVGEGLYHLFHKQKAPTPPAPPSVSEFQAPKLLTQKFTDAVPSIDTSVDRSGAVMNF
jgi:polyhydroxyalkanoate synthesis regulator phasin